jgi:hypothetical protein
MRWPRSGRRLEEDLLDRALTGGRSERADLDAMVQAARMLRGSLSAAPEPQAVERGRLVALGAFQAAGGSQPRARQRSVSGLLLRVAAAAAALFVLSALLLVATWPVAARALPGDLLYRAKLGFEGARLALASGPLAEGEVYLDIAEVRVEELVRAEAEGRTDALVAVLERYLDVVAAFEERLAQARSARLDVGALSARAERAFSVHRTILAGLLDIVPEAARPGIERAIEVSGGGVPTGGGPGGEAPQIPPTAPPPVPPTGPPPTPPPAPPSAPPGGGADPGDSFRPEPPGPGSPPRSPGPPEEVPTPPSGPKQGSSAPEEYPPGPSNARNR